MRTQKELFVVMELWAVYVYRVWPHDRAEGEPLFEHLCDKKTYSEQDAKTLVKEVLIALAYMHAKGIAHRDIKVWRLTVSYRVKISYVTYESSHVSIYNDVSTIDETSDENSPRMSCVMRRATVSIPLSWSISASPRQRLKVWRLHWELLGIRWNFSEILWLKSVGTGIGEEGSSFDDCGLLEFGSDDIHLVSSNDDITTDILGYAVSLLFSVVKTTETIPISCSTHPFGTSSTRRHPI